MKVVVHVEKVPGESNCACFIDGTFDGCGLAGYGPTVDAAVADLLAVRGECVAEGRNIPELEMEFKYDLWAFFETYPLNATMVARQIGINPSLMRQYVAGVRRPSKRRLDEIQRGVNEIGRRLAAVRLERH